MAVLVCLVLDPFFPIPTLALVFVIAVLAVGVRTRPAVSLYAAGLGSVAYNFFFTEPRLTLYITRPEDFVAVLAFLIAGGLCLLAGASFLFVRRALMRPSLERVPASA